MSKKVSERAIGIVVGIVGVAIIGIAIYLTANMSKGTGETGKAPAGNILGPETVQNGTTTTGQQTAFNTPVSDPAPDPKAVATPPIEFKSDFMTFKAKLPNGAPGDPVVAYLVKDTNDYLAKKRADAEAALKDAKAKKLNAIPWEFEVNWDWTAKAGGLVSAAGTSSEFEGGAHGLVLYDTLIARAASGEKIDFNSMFVSDKSPSPAVQIGICEGLKKAKTARTNAPTIYDDPIVCAGPKANAHTDKTKIALAPSNQPGKFGGIWVYYPLYEVGPYAEGSYAFEVQQSVFAEDLKPEYKALFGGVAPSPDNT